MSILCPQCKHSLKEGKDVKNCPSCGWDLSAEIAQTLKSKTALPTDVVEDTPPPGTTNPVPREASVETTPTLEARTLEPPGRPTLSGGLPGTASNDDEEFDLSDDFMVDSASELTAKENMPTLDLRQPEPDPQKLEREEPEDDVDSNLKQTLPSVGKPTAQSHDTGKAGSNNPEIDETIVPSRSGSKLPTVQRSINTVIPPRSITRSDKSEKLQDYKIEKRIGSGSFGVVYRALQVPLDRTVALKVLTSGDSASEEYRERVQTEFLREAQFTGKLEHPNIVPIHDIGLTEDRHGETNRPFYVMKEIHGDSWLQRIGKLTRSENLEIFKRVVDAIGFAHDKQVLHCDLKPENVMLGEFGEVLIVDWGQAIDLSHPATMRPGGTPAYISPEMANYWCDIYLDRKAVSPSQSKVGPRSDVYLLGGILFEIITGKIPRSATEGESQYDVMRRACDNEIEDAPGFDDELMQIARRSLRISNQAPIETIDELQNAIKEFETRALSIELRERADALLADAKKRDSYDDFQRARFGYEEALDKWPENSSALVGLRDTRLSCAGLALNDQNFDLGIDMLAQPETEPEKQTLQLLIDGKKRRDRRQQLVRYLAIALAISIIVGIGVNAFMIERNIKTARLRDEALRQKAVIEQEKTRIEQEIEPLRNEIAEYESQIREFPAILEREQRKLTQEKQKLAADLAREKTEFERKLAAERMKFSVQEKAFADQAAALANQLKTEQTNFAAEKNAFDQQRDHFKSQINNLEGELTNLSQSSKILRFKSAITNISQSLQNGNFRDARQSLDSIANKRNWEWARLNLLAHREIQSIYPNQSLVDVAASPDGKFIGFVFENQVQFHECGDFDADPLIIPISRVQSLALSNNGRLIAMGIPATTQLDPGTIELLDLSSPKKPVRIASLDAQSNSIQHLEFSADSKRLLSVGRPSPLRKSSSRQSEEELMIWSDAWQRIDVDLTNAEGSIPKFNRASFSVDGSKIITCNPGALGRDQHIHVFSESERGYQWMAQSPAAFLNFAIFTDDSGTEVATCFRDPKAGTYALATWNPLPETGPRTPNGNVTGQSNRDSFSIVTAIEDKILFMWRSENWLVTSGQDRMATIWDWNTRRSKRYRGHSSFVDFCSLNRDPTRVDPILFSVATGNQPEILKTDLSTYRDETIATVISDSPPENQPSPTTLYRSEVTGQMAFGNDQGTVSVSLATEPTDDTKRPDPIQWEVSAWKNHFLADDFVFAQSRQDFFYRFNRRSGAIEKVLIDLAPPQVPGEPTVEITGFDVSSDGRIAVVTTSRPAPEFEIWDLESQTRLHTINYGEDSIFGRNTEKQLRQFHVSPDGKWVVAGKVGVFAWSTDTGLQRRLLQPGADLARSSISAICFVPGTSQFVASWKDRIDLFDLEVDGPAKRYSVPQLSYNNNEPNILDGAVFDGQILLLIRATADAKDDSGIILYDLRSQTELKAFEDAKVASFCDGIAKQLLVVKEISGDSRTFRYEVDSAELAEIDFGLNSENRERFRNVRNIKQFSDGSLILQSTVRNAVNPVRPNWNSISFRKDLASGPLRVFAKPKIEYCAVASDTVLTLDSGKLRFWRVRENGIRPDGVFEGNYRHCRLSPDEKTIALVPEDDPGRILLVDLKRRSEFARITTELSGTSSLAWSSNSSKIAVGQTTGAVEIWETQANQIDFQKTATLPSMAQAVSTVAFSGDGTALLAVHANEGLARVCRLNAFNRWQSVIIRPEDGQALIDGDIAWDGNRIVTGAANGRLTIWNTSIRVDQRNIQTNQSGASATAERKLLELEKMHDSPIQFVQFNKNSKSETEIVSAETDAGDNRYLIWCAQPEGQ